MKRLSIPAILIATVALSACGTAPTDRAVSGAGIGAGTGAVIGAITSASVAEAALLGAAAGGLAGVLTTRDQVNMGEPVWKQQANAQPAPSAAAPPSYGAYAGNQTVADIQAALGKVGLYRGPVDGIAGPKTQSAIRAYQQRHGLLVDGRATPELLNHIQQHGAS